MRVAITGSSGFIGTHLVERLRRNGHDVVPVVRRQPLQGELRWSPSSGELAADAFTGCDAVVHLAGAGIGDRRWTTSYKQTLLDSRIDGTSLIARTLATMTDDRPQVWISGSAVGIYGDRGDEVLDERSALGDADADFLVHLCREWEASTRPAADAGVRVVNIRSGIVLGKDGGALKKQLPLFRLGLGGKLGSGRQWQSWITVDDNVSAIEHLLSSSVSGPVNLTAPAPVTNAQLTKALGRALRRPAVLPVPRQALAIVLGRDLTATALLASQRVLPRVIEEDGFEFTQPTIDSALAGILTT